MGSRPKRRSDRARERRDVPALTAIVEDGDTLALAPDDDVESIPGRGYRVQSQAWVESDLAVDVGGWR